MLSDFLLDAVGVEDDDAMNDVSGSFSSNWSFRKALEYSFCFSFLELVASSLALLASQPLCSSSSRIVLTLFLRFLAQEWLLLSGESNDGVSLLPTTPFSLSSIVSMAFLLGGLLFFSVSAGNAEQLISDWVLIALLLSSSSAVLGNYVKIIS